MTEEEWLVTEDTFEMYWWIRPEIAKYRDYLPKMTRRLGSLYAVACIRATPQAADQPFLVKTAEVAERAADTGNWTEVAQLLEEAERRNSDAANTTGIDSIPHLWALAALRLTQDHIDKYAMHVPHCLRDALVDAANIATLRKTYADLLRDIAGNPFGGSRGCQLNRRKRKPQLEPIFRPEWRTDTVLSLARTMYDTREFSAMPILADALQDVGCDNPDILNHCRDTSLTHVRGCWAVDLVLGKV